NAKTEVLRQHPEETDPDSRAAYRLLTRPKPKPKVEPGVTRIELPAFLPKWLKIGFGVLVLALLSVIAARGQTIVFQDEGITQVRRAGGQVGVNFAGAGVICAPQVAGITTCTITGGGASGYQTIQDEGSALTQRTILNFIGSGVSCVDSVPSTRTDCTITAGAGATHQIDAVALTSQDPINFLDTSVFDWTNPAVGNLSLAIKATSIDLTTKVTGTLPVGNGGTGTATAFTLGSVVFAGTSGVYAQDNANFFWDDTANKLDIPRLDMDQTIVVTEIRTIPAVVDDTIEIGSLTMGSNRGGSAVEINVATNLRPRGARKYLASYSYQQQNTVWTTLKPLYESTSDAGVHDYEIESKVANQTILFRLRNTVGTISDTASILIRASSGTVSTWTSSSTTASEVAPTVFQETALLTFEGGAIASGRGGTVWTHDSVFDVVTGYRIGGAAATDNCLLGNATNFVASSTCALSTDKLDFFAATTVAQLATVLSDENFTPGSEASAEGVLDLPDLQGQVAAGQYAASSIDSDDLATANKTFKCNFVLFRD
ncbi:hypothetical protein LCGC14_2378790, partial [marine sediment metagenome]